jgi:hypothetical protein
MLGVLLIAAIFATSAQALDEPKVTITYSLEVGDGGAYWQDISGTTGTFGDAYYVMDVVTPVSPKVNVYTASPLEVTMEFTADAGGNIIDGPVELTDTHFERHFDLSPAPGTVVDTVLSTNLSRVATGTLSGSTITWDNVAGVNVYQELVVGSTNCTPFPGFVCNLAAPWPKNLGGTNEVPLPTFSVNTNSVFADAFVSDNGTPCTGAPCLPAPGVSDDIDRFDPAATVKDTWYGVQTSRVFSPEPVPAISEIYLLVSALGLVGLGCLRKRNGASA